MPVITRTALFIALAAALAACSTATQGGATPSTGNPPPSAAESGGHEVFGRLGIHPNAGTRAFLMNFVANGPNQGGVPCINCVNGASTSDNIGMTGPSSYVLTGRVWQYTISFTDISYHGNCKLVYDIASGKKTIDKFSKTLGIPASAEGGFILYSIPRPRPKYSGPATFTGTVTCGKDTQSAAAPLEFQ